MLSNDERLARIMDRELIGFLTAVDESGQPQTAPVWFLRDGDDVVVYNRATTPRLVSLRSNPKVAFNLRGDSRARGAITLEGAATIADLPPALEFPGYVDKYRSEIERLGWTPETFSDDYSVGIRMVVTRARTWGLDILDR